jgi:hypothetical protein
MVDQTQDEILEVQIKNKQIKYANDTEKMFDEWLYQCPVVYYLSEKVDEEVNKIIKYTFDKKVRRK